uniref:FYVE, RhoGEF and PH domain containing 6 n=1 Tax=Mastacembelus armatus TaxID=205130 RepID=A0A7N8YFW7_9TELE
MQKPPVAPKPKMAQPQMPGLSPATPRRNGLMLPSPSTPRRVKPVPAPKPCLSKLTTAAESKPLASNSLQQMSVKENPQTVGLLNSKNGIKQENRKLDWDYIIPVCLCSRENCKCIRNASANVDKMGRTLRKSKTDDTSEGTVDYCGERTDNAKSQLTNANPSQNVSLRLASTSTHLTNHKSLHKQLAVDKNLNTDISDSSPVMNFRPSHPHRTWSDEANGNVIPPSAPGPVPEEDALGTELLSCVSEPKPVPEAPRKPVPVPRKPRIAVLAHQEKVEEEKKEGIVSQEGKEMNAVKVKVSSEGKGSSSLSVSVPVSENKQPIFLSARKACATRAPPPQKKPFLSAPEKMPTSAPKTFVNDVEEEDLGWDNSIYEMEVSVDKKAREVEKGGRDHQEPLYSNLTYCALSNGLLTQPELSQPPSITGAAEENRVVKAAPKKPQRHCGPMAWMQKKEFSEEKEELKLRDNEKRTDTVTRESLPLDEKTNRTLLTDGITRPSRSSRGKQRAKSFSDADLIHSEAERSNSFRKLLGLKLSVKKLMVKGGQSPDISANNNEQSVDMNQDEGQHIPVDVRERKLSCPLVGVEQNVDGDEFGIEQSVHYETICHYEEIPDYMNVEVGKAGSSPRASFSQSWRSEMYNEGIYEEQEPYISSGKHTGHQQFQLPTDFREVVSRASRQNGKPVIEEHLLNQILYYLPQLYHLNQDLLRELRHRVAKWDENAQLADIFLKKGPYLKMYSTYIREFDKNVALLDEQSKRNPAFGAVVREFEASPRCANLALKHYLLKPVQRIPQYQLLLTDYLKNLSEDSVDYKDTQAALALVKEVANHANDIMKQGDNFQKLIQVQCSLNGHHEIVQPGRIFLKEGVLMKLSRKVMQPRMFFLFNDVLLYATPVQSGQYKLNNMLSLAGMKVSKPSQEAYQNELNIESVERSFILYASSDTERDEWLEAISTAIRDYTKKKISFISVRADDDGAPLGSKAPIWIPDPRTTMCMICTCEFTLTWRRHHCRACGKVVCQACSSNKYCLEYLKMQLARVCDQCFSVLDACLDQVSANTDTSSMSGYMQRSKGSKKHWKRLWFVIKDKVLYTYAASEDVAALESQPLLGFVLKADSSQKLQFKLYHKNTLYYIFKADDDQTAQRYSIKRDY